MSSEPPSRIAALAARLAAARARGEALPGAPLVREVLQNERDLGGGLIAGGVAFRVFLWLVPFGLVVAALLSFRGELDQDGLESAARRFGIGAAAAQAASEALELGDRNRLVILVFGLFLLAWFAIGAVRPLLLAYALVWRLGHRASGARFASWPSSTGSFSGDPVHGRGDLARGPDRVHRAPRLGGLVRSHARSQRETFATRDDGECTASSRGLTLVGFSRCPAFAPSPSSR